MNRYGTKKKKRFTTWYENKVVYSGVIDHWFADKKDLNVNSILKGNPSVC